MKKLFVIMICVGAGFTAASQKVRTVPVPVYHHVYAFRPVYGFGVGYYPPFYSPFGFYGLPYGTYYPYGAVYSKPTRLQKEEEDIRADYSDRIYSVRQDDSLTNKQKRQEVRALKKQRDQEIHDLIVSYHQRPRKENQEQPSANQQQDTSVQ